MENEFDSVTEIRQFIDKIEELKKTTKMNGIKALKKQIKVKHMPNSAKYKPKKYNTWKEYWEDKSGKNFRQKRQYVLAAISQLNLRTLLERILFQIAVINNSSYIHYAVLVIVNMGMGKKNLLFLKQNEIGVLLFGVLKQSSSLFPNKQRNRFIRNRNPFSFIFT